jgi:hypothetical protein
MNIEQTHNYCNVINFVLLFVCVLFSSQGLGVQL